MEGGCCSPSLASPPLQGTADKTLPVGDTAAHGQVAWCLVSCALSGVELGGEAVAQGSSAGHLCPGPASRYLRKSTTTPSMALGTSPEPKLGQGPNPCCSCG